ncbi:COMPASS complex protein [Mycena metata]|uniref:COMPASS complex protein n=1 Tax=Mycena metata TaxID=1033252 RepID=A0AAD7IZN8_9AGAR|nr:COMPASS complex protein [Mycena metata]
MDDLQAPTSSAPVPPATPVPHTQSRKRKRAPPTAASPAPSEPAANGNPPEVLSSRTNLSTRPQLSISRGPNFLPVAEGSEFFKTELTGVNRIGYRYTPAGINPPGHFLPCRTIESNPTAYRISWEDRSSFVQVTKDGLSLAGSTGFRSARCNAPIREGRWYMEVKVIHGGGEHLHEDGKHEGSHVRLGWGRREAPLNGPVGLDGYSYGYRDKTGDKVTLSRPRPYGRPFSSGDVIGMYICLPARRQADPKDPNDPARIKRERIAIDLKGQEVFEILEYPQSKEMAALMVDYSGKSSTSASIPSSSKKIASGKLPERGPSNAPKTNAVNLRPLPTLPDSYIAFFVNGECQGIAFQDLYDYLQLRPSAMSRKSKGKRTREGVKEHIENPFDDGTLGYYPFISLFNEACVRLNPGPTFDFPPPPDIDALSKEQNWRPTCERYAEFMTEQWALDAVEEEEASSDAARAATLEKAAAEKRAQRNKKRQQTEARKRAKILENSSAADEGAATTANNTSGPGQPSPLRHGTAYIPDTPDSVYNSDDTSFTSTTHPSGPGNPSPLRQATGSSEWDLSPTKAEDKSPAPLASLLGPGQASSSRPRAPYAYGFPPEFRSAMEDVRFEPTISVPLSGPGQPSERLSAYAPSKFPANIMSDEPPRPRLLSGPGQPSSPRLASVYGYGSRDLPVERSPFTIQNLYETSHPDESQNARSPFLGK